MRLLSPVLAVILCLNMLMTGSECVFSWVTQHGSTLLHIIWRERYGVLMENDHLLPLTDI